MQDQSADHWTNGQSFDLYADEYLQLLSFSTGDEIGRVDYYARRKVSFLKRMIGGLRPRHILDYGCGIGLSLSPLRQAFPEARLYATDPSSRSLAVAAERNREHDVTPLPFSDLDDCKQTFDLVFSFCVFHHIDESKHDDTLKRLRSLCSAAGNLVVAEHNPRNPITRSIVRRCPFDQGVTLISRSAMEDRMERSGWQQIRSRYITFVPARLARFSALEILLPWCPLGGQYMTCGSNLQA